MKIGFWDWLPFRRWRIVGNVADADDVPDKIPRRGVVVVGSFSRPKWIIFDCACGDGHRIMLNADANRRPTWMLKDRNDLTIHPSIDFHTEKVRCHYFVRNGKTVWAKDSKHGRGILERFKRL